MNGTAGTHYLGEVERKDLLQSCSFLITVFDYLIMRCEAHYETVFSRFKMLY